MERLLNRSFVLAALACTGAAAFGAELSDRHQLEITLNWSVTDAVSDLTAWPAAGSGKLRYGAADLAQESARLFIEYNGQIASQWYAHAVADYLDDADSLGLTEAYVEWRPLPSNLNRHRFRFGAFYPAISLENSDSGWDSPYSRSFSAINTWLGEEIRPIGAEWRLSRHPGSAGSPHELGASAALFYGNDTAATLLFWRGWSVHDRQTRLNEILPLPTLVFPTGGSGPDIEVSRTLDPIAEIDHEPGFAVSGDWQYARLARLSIGFWDNRADAYRFRDGQWAWGTRFWHFGAKFSLPGDIALLTQRMRGDTDWLIQVTPTGQLTPDTSLATDEFDASFLLLSKTIGTRHRISLRYDDFDIWRFGGLTVDTGNARTIAYRYAAGPRLEMQLEWLRIDSTRDLWPIFYQQANRQRTETLIELGFRLVLFDSTS